MTPYRAYLQNTSTDHHKHYFIAVLREGSAWVVKTAWGRIGDVQGEKTYTGGRSGEFTNKTNAAAYARAIVKNKIGEGYAEVTYPPKGGVVPMWFTEITGEDDHGEDDHCHTVTVAKEESHDDHDEIKPRFGRRPRS